MADQQRTTGSQPAPPRIYYLHHRLIGALDGFPPELERIAGLGFTEVLIPPVFRPGPGGDVFHPQDHELAAPWLGDGLGAREALAQLAEACRAAGLRLMMDLDLTRFAAGHALVERWPDAFAIRRSGEWTGPVDPRRPPPVRGVALARLEGPGAQPIAAWADEHLGRWLEAGLEGVRLIRPEAAPAGFWRGRIEAARAVRPGLVVIADTPGLPREVALGLKGSGVDRLISSLPWWDGRARWLAEEHEALRLVAPLVAAPEEAFAGRLCERLPADADVHAVYAGRLLLAAALGAGLMVPMGFEYGARDRLETAAGSPEDLARWRREARFDLSAELRIANAVTAELEPLSGEMRILTPVDSQASAVLLTDAADARDAERGLLALINVDSRAPAEVAPASFLWGAGAGFGPFERLGGEPEAFGPLGPGEVRLLLARRERAITQPARPTKTGAKAAARQPRIVIEDLWPRVDGGPFPVKRIVGEEVVVEADVFAEGHTAIAVELQWRAIDEDRWRSARMAPLGNDRWRAAFPLERIGRWDYRIEAWIDVFGGYRDGLLKKLAARVAGPVDFEEGRLLILAAAGRAEGELKAALQTLADALSPCTADKAPLLTAPETAALMARADERPFRLQSEPQGVDAERLSARFGSWYELFPRSQTDHPSRHGTFDDVIARLPDIRDMGFDVLYFPPIHPIGRTNRKGRDNSLIAAPDDPGSPYGIGADEGGHTAVHPELGTLEDFRRLVAAAREHGLEIALDFAIQCSPDHPWLKQHPGWFDWRPDGTIKFAENPPKRYEDIVNVDFYAKDAVPDLWCALRDAVAFWVKQGVKTFRVDNPHTKPLPFWEWMIADIRRADPEVIFLAEAFTRPKLMYRLAKLGFSQSYTYFTWRHSKQEFIDYLTELTQTPPAAFFRPHFFVNTPDINPYVLQGAGRGAFLIRAALAATLSGLWGVYSGFELLESDPVPGKEEYRDSEKYEIKPRDWNAPGNIKAEIARLNRIRRGEPALQTHLDVSFYNAFNESVLYFGKALPGERDRVLVAISLDPHHAQEADFELPLWEWGLPDHGALDVCDLVHDRSWIWHGKRQHLRLEPHEPYAIWRVQPAETQ